MRILLYGEDGAYKFDVFGMDDDGRSWLAFTPLEQRQWLVAQNFVAFSFVLYMGMYFVEVDFNL
jgi:hypothetical protein